ncbi:MAG: aminotransferase class I/II-fold pyridoxal phosphate-dependent enzyme [Muribaculaceae bacterium]|nr:aminotransferase class I/II-fold pyridoxal phosphate-dependent enzyme [Muribaculaceae bacterium]
MQAIILAAGMGRRLGEFTADNTKCMLEVNGIRLIDRMLTQLQKLNLSRIVVVIGYEGQKLKNYISQNYPDWSIKFVENNVYDKTNNIYSLWLARGYMAEEETLLLESDLIFEDEVLDAAVNSEYKDCALISKYETWMDGTMVRIDDDNNIINFIPKKAFKYSDTQYYYKTVNIYKFSKEFVVNHYLPFLEAYIQVLGENEYYEQVLRVITLIDTTGIKALPITGLHWYEIDDVQDLRIAETIFANPEERLKKLQQSFGGYWRYPSLLDFCYLVNPYFPRQKMIDEMKANFEPLLRDYPSGMGVNSLLASKYFGIRHDYAVVGNGAAELIKSLMTIIDGNIGIIYPTFEEYPNRLDKERIVPFHPNNEDFSYTADDLIEYYTEHQVRNLLIVNPDNPSGNLIDREDLDKLASWTKENNIRLIIDESFVDFADKAEEMTLIHNEVLEENPHLCVMKSISKSYGVPGLRLGVLVSADKSLIQHIRKDVGIWNINSFAEFYMQIYSKYEKDYARSCEKFRKEREIFYKELNEIPFLRVISSQANYFLCEITDKFTSHELALKLLTDFNILIKDCSSKKGFPKDKQFIRIAIRDRKDDDKLTRSLDLITK